ncbi:MAG: hypothetical protein HWN65_13825 [Candidatus Helarchaeota archaeon]|nr:hypothetical protein [Candidatus Helarchaeota archaeon]
MGPARKVRGRPRVTCNFGEDLCTGSRCTYSFCTKHKMRPDGTCNLRDRPTSKQSDDKIEQKFEKELISKEREETRYKSMIKDKYLKKLKGKKW